MPKQSGKNSGQITAVIESTLDLGEAAMGVLGEIECMVGAGEGGLQIAQEGINLWC